MVIRLYPEGLSDIIRVQEISQRFTQQQPTGAARLTTNPASPLPAGTPVVGVVSAQSGTGVLTLTLPLGQTMDITAGRQLPLGTRITLQVPAEGQPPQILSIQLPAGNMKGDALITLNNLGERMTHMTHTLAPATAAAVMNRLPQALSTNFLPALLLMAEAATTGNYTRPLGKEALNTLRKNNPDFEKDISANRELASKGSTNAEWRGFVFPILAGDVAGEGKFFWRHEENPDNPRESHTRIITEVDLSELGPVQLDGLLVAKDLSLKIRLHQPLTEVESNGLKQSVANTLISLGYTGRASIETTPRFETDPIHEILSTQHRFNIKA